jgi:hypothetical protein
MIVTLSMIRRTPTLRPFMSRVAEKSAFPARLRAVDGMLVAIVGLAVLLRVWSLGTQSLWYEPSFTGMLKRGAPPATSPPGNALPIVYGSSTSRPLIRTLCRCTLLRLSSSCSTAPPMKRPWPATRCRAR